MSSSAPTPDPTRHPSLTTLLRRWSRDPAAEGLGGDEEALARVYEELRRVAARTCAKVPWTPTLQATALAHEAYLVLRRKGRLPWRNRRHFFAVAARMMRQILVDSVRRRASLKRGGGVRTVSLEEAGELAAGVRPDLLRLDAALSALAAVDRRKARVVELRFFGGLTLEEISAELGIAPATAQRDWRAARAWLYRELVADEA